VLNLEIENSAPVGNPELDIATLVLLLQEAGCTDLEILSALREHRLGKEIS